MAKLIPLEYQGMSFHANSDTWFNATEMAAMFDKRVNDWLNLKETQDYIARLNANSNTSQNGIWWKAKRGHNGGTWLHRKLAIRFAGWCDFDFAIWCDEQIETMLTNGQTWQKHRTELSSITVLRNRFIAQKRNAEGKATEPYHFSNESLVVNEALTGKRTAIDRDSLTLEQIAMLDKLEQENVLMLLQNIPYQKRKQCLFDLAAPIRHQMQITSIGGVAL